jgi:hypothetical protein
METEWRVMHSTIHECKSHGFRENHTHMRARTYTHMQTHEHIYVCMLRQQIQ